MARRHLFYSLFAIVLIVASAGIPVESRGAAALQDQGQDKKLSAGRNVNMVSGMTLPNGDPWLQRQNEPSLTVSTHNTLHLLAGSNDYRTVDMPLENEQLPGREGPLAAAPDAWLGLYKSVDGGQSWASTLLPGFPQDTSAAGKASPLKYTPAKKRGFTAAADPVVRSGPSGMFYYSGIAFNRTQIPGWVNGALFISRFIDKNNAEAGDAIQYIDTQIIANDNKVDTVFIDKPWIVVDAPQAGAKLITISGQNIPRHNVYIAYSIFIEVAKKHKNQTSSINFQRSTDCGKSWGAPLVLNQDGGLHQGATIAIDPRDNGNVYVAWRRFDAKKKTDAIMVARSRTKGDTFENSKVVAEFSSLEGSFDQPSTIATEFPYGTSFRTNSYPTMAVDDKGIVYVAWTQRGHGPTGEARIMLATSPDSRTWSTRTPIDSSASVQGHQFMPSLAFAAGKLTLAWYDQRDDYCGLNFGFDNWISDGLSFRHTIDVRAAQADTANFPNLHWKTTQISRYNFTLEEDHDNRGKYKAFQSQWNPPNYPLFSTGTLPFHGDYLDVAPSPMFVRSEDGRWRFNTAVSDNPLFHIAWTDNRDVRPPLLGDWANYAPPTSAQLTQYITPGRPVCTGGQQPGMRNQNVYTAQLFSGIEAGSPTNAKALDLDVPRAFAVFVKNNTWDMKSFRLSIAAQPPNGQASFLQFDLLEYLDVTIAPYSTISRQVFISSTDQHASVTVLIEEIDMPEGSVLPDGMTSSVLLNGDPSSPGIVGGEETHEPQIENPHIRNWSVNAIAVNPEIDNEDIVNTDIVNPNIVDLGTINPAIVNPNVVDPSLFNPHIRNVDYLNPNIVNPHIRNPHIRNESPEDLSVTDVEWPVKNIGNTASSFSFTLIAKEALPEGLYAQLIVYKVHYTPAVAGGALAGNMKISGCELKQEPHHEVLLNVVNPDIVNPHIRNPNLLNPHIRNAAIENATFVLGPGEEAIVNLRIIESHEAQMTRAMTTLQGFEIPVEIGSFIESVGAAVTAQSVDSEDAAQGIEEPKTDATTLIISTSSLPPGTIGLAYPQAPYLVDQARIQAAGGKESYSWWVNPDELPPGLTFSAASGQIFGMPLKETGKTYPRVYSFTVQVTDSGSPQQSANQRFSIAIEDPTVPPPPLTITTASPLPAGTEGTPYGTALNAVGGVWPYTWTRVFGSLPQGLSMDELGTIGGTPSLAGTFAFSVRVVDSGSPARYLEKAYGLTIRAADAPTFSISGRVTLGAGGASFPGVLMRGLPSAPTTDASGSYSDTVPAGWSGTAIPFKAGYYFVPAEISYANVQSHRLGQNYVAYPVTLDHFDISHIGNAIAGVPFPVTITAKDSSGVTVTTYTDANILSDTTGTISPKMTGPFTNGVWTGQAAIIKTAPGVVIQTSGGGRTGQSNSFDVALGAPSAIRIEDAPDGTGTEVVTKTLGPGHALTVYAVSRDLGNNFVANVAVAWSLIDKTGRIVDGDLVPAGDNMSAVFTAHAAGAARIRAEHASLGADTTGTITVMEAQVDDAYEDNDDRANAAPISLGTHTNLVLMDEDWFKITVSPTDAGKDLMIHLKGVSYPNPDIRKDLDMLVLDGSGRLMGYNISGGDDEYAFIPGVAAGDYTIGLTYIPVEGVVYSLTAEVGTNFGIGYIEGRVTDKNGYGLENILVELYGDPFNWDNSRPMTTTGANGLYKIGFFPGHYTVLFNITNPDWQAPLVPDVNYLGETYHGNEVVTLVAGATVPGINTQLEPGGAITGRVTDSSGNGLNMAVFYVHAGDATRVAAGYADANGNYVADRLYTGNYKVRVRQDAIYGLEWYGNAPSLADGLPVPVRQGATTSGIDVELGPDMAYLQGRVTDNLGNPISGVLVSAFDEAGINVAGAKTDEAGNYRIPRLSTGEVRIYFDAAPGQGNYVSKYFPNEDLLTRAIPVPVKAGETTSGIDAQLANGGTISGRVTGAPGIGIPGISIRCFDTNGDRYFGTTTDATGNYTLAHVWPDDYKVLFRPETGSLAAEWHSDWSSSSGARVITVGAGQVITGIDAQLAAQGGSISGTATGTGPIKNVQVLAYDSTRGTLGAHISSTATDATGTYRIPRLPGTEYKVFFNADRNFLGYNSEYYQSENKFADAWPVTVVLGQEYPGIGAVLSDRPPLEITTTALPEGKQSTFYSASLEASGGRPFYFWSVETGALPNGLTLNGKGEIRGNPSAAGTFNFTVRVTDSTRPQQSDTQALAITVAAYGGTGFLVSGKIMAGGSPVAGVVMNGLPGNPTTNALGEYSSTVSSGWSGTVTPTLMGYAFNPPAKTYANVTANLQDQDYLASPGITISGTITLSGTPLPGVLMSGLPGEPRTNSSGFYTASVPSGWSTAGQPITPMVPGFSFTPPSRAYSNVTAPQTAQDFTATYAAGADDGFEENDTYETAATITLGTSYNNLVLADEDWFKVYVPASPAGSILRVHIKGLTYPDPAARRDLDFRIVSGTRKLLSYNISGGDDEYAYIPDLAEGWYYIGHNYIETVGTVYSLSVDIGTDFGLGFIEGRVTDEQGNGIEGIYVELNAQPFNQVITYPLMMTGANGHYKIGFTPGEYTVRFNQQNFGHRDPWITDLNYIGEAYAHPISLSPGSMSTGIDARLAQGGTITGRLTDETGNPLRGSATVYASNASRLISGSADVNGNYLIERVPEGNHKVVVIPSLTQYGLEWYGDRASFGDAIPVPVTAGLPTPDINFRLGGMPGYIEGTVTNSSGTPIQGVVVTAYDVAGISLTTAPTDSAGHYRLTRLPAGPLKIYFSQSSANPTYASEYYPDKFLIEEAVPVMVTPGGTTAGIDAQLAQAGRISGRVTDPAGNGLYLVYVYCTDVETLRTYSATTDLNGYYTVSRILPDIYRVRFRPDYGNWAVEWFDDKAAFTAGNLVTVGAGQIAENINAQLDGDGGLITGQVTASGGVPIEGVRVYARDVVKTMVISQALTDAAGNYTLRRLPTGETKVHFDTDTDFLAYATEYYNNKGAFETADPVATVRGGTTANINAVLAPVPAFTITTASLPGGEIGVVYSASLQASGGRPFYYFKLESGALPNGLTLNGKGEIQGTPTAIGTFNFTVGATDSTRPRQSDTKAFTITIGAYTGAGYLVSGKCLAGGSPVPGVVMAGLPGSPATDAQGDYIAPVTSGWSGTVTPTRPGYAFTPTNRVYANVSTTLQNQDYAAAAGYTISGAITLGGAPLPGVLMSGLPGGPRTNSSGVYSAAVPAGWSGSAAPALPGFTFSPSNRDYNNVTANASGQNFTAVYAGGTDDAFENNDSFETAAVITPGAYNDLVLTDEDWFRIYVPASDAGKILRVHIKGTACPDPAMRHDLDFAVIDQNRKLLSYNISGGDDEYAYIPDLAEGWYYIAHNYIDPVGAVYSLSVDIGADFGLGFIEGRVTDEQGAGIEGVYVELYDTPFDWNVSRPLITTRQDGTYKVCWTPGNFTVRFNIQNWYHRDPLAPDVNFIGQTYNAGQIIPLAASSRVSGIDARLSPGGAVTGRVTDAEGNQLFSAVAAYGADALSYAAATTNPDGSYILDRFPTGNYKIRFRPPGAGLGILWYEGGATFDAAVPVPVVAGQTTPNINGLYGPGGYIEGVVTNASGTPIQGVSVSTYDVSGISLGISATTGQNGAYRLTRLPAGPLKVFFNPPVTSQNYVAEYYPDKFLIGEAGPVMVTAGGTTSGIDAQLAEGGMITGRVTDTSGNGLIGITVLAIDIETERYYSAVTDANGYYTINRVWPDTYRIRFRAESGNWAVEWFDDKSAFATGDPVTVGAGGHAENIDARLDADGGFITGSVTAAGGVPIEGVRIFARDSVKTAMISQTFTDAAGNYSLPRLPTGQARVSFDADANYLAYITEHYNDKSTLEAGDVVATARGETTTNINAVLAPIPSLTILTGSLPAGLQFTPYNVALVGEGGRQFYYWTLAPGSDPMPAGLKLTGKGEILGTPLATGTYNLIVRVADSTRPQQSDTQSLTLNIAQYTGTGYYISGHVYVGGAPLPGVVLEGLPGPPATNLQGNYITFVPAGYSGMARPVLAGYGFDPETDGYTNLTTNRPGQDYVAYRVTLVVTTDWLPNGTEGQAYTQILGATGGTSPYTWALYSGLLPDGLTLASDGTLSGTPVKTGTYDFTVRVTDLGTPTQRVYQAYSVTINSGGLISTTPLLVWKLNEGYGTTALDSSGRGLHGLLHNNVTYTSDAAGGWGYAAETIGSGWIEKNWGGDKNFYFGNTTTIMAYVKIADFSSSRRFVWKLQHDRTDRGFPYCFQAELSIEGSKLVIHSNNGLLKGAYESPSFATELDLSNGANGFVLGAYNHLTVTIQGNQYKLFINGAEKASAAGAPFDAGANFSCFWVMGANWSDYWLGGKLDELTVYNTALTPAQVGSRYSEGPLATVSGRVTSGGAPLSGVAMNGLPGSPLTDTNGNYIGSISPGWTGTVSPSRAGNSFEPPGRAYTNVRSSIAGEDYTAYVGGSLYVSTGSLPAGAWNSPYDVTIQAAGGTPPYSWTIASGRLPGGLTLNTNGRLNGTPTEAGDFPFTVRVTDSSATPQFVTRNFTFIIVTAHEGFWTTTYPFGGEIYAQGLALDPADPFVIFASANNMGIFRSEDGAVHWTSNLIDSPNWPYGEICYSIFIAHQASGNLYMSTGGRILRSTDRGSTWNEIYMRNTWDIQALAVDPENANLIYVGTQQEGIVRTANGGATWAAWGSGLPREEFRVIVVAPNNPGILYAGMNPSGIFASRDAGATWTEADTGLNFDYIDDIEVHPSDPDTVYALARMSTPSYDQGIYKTTNGGLNWVKLHDAGMGRWSGGGIAIDPTNANIVYVASNQSVLKTTDGGTSWTEYTVSTANTEAIVISPRNTQVLYAGTVGEGVYKSINGGANWTAVNSGLRAVGFVGDSAHAIEFDKTNPKIIYAGSLNGGYRSLDRGLNWEKMGFPQWAPLALRTHIDAPNVVFGLHNAFHKSTSNGTYGTFLQTPGSPCCFPRGDIGVSTTSPLVIYFGCWGSTNPQTGVYKSLDRGDTFTLKNNGLTNTEIHSIAVHPLYSDIVFAGTLGDWPFNPAKDYGLFKTTNGGENWHHVTSGLPHDLDIRCIVIHPTFPNIMYLASGGGENSGIYRSDNGGDSWARMSTRYADALAVNPTDPNILFGGEHNGFWVSFNGGATWTQVNDGLLRNPRIDAITLDPANPNRVFIGTAAGVYEATFDFAPTITTAFLPDAVINQPYNVTLTAARGTTPYTWSHEGTLPGGLSLDPATGVVSGQTVGAGVYTINVTVMDNVGRSFRKPLTLNVLAMYPLAATSTPPEGGAVTRTPNQPLYVQGTFVEVAAAANPGYTFIGWSGEAAGKTIPARVTMTESKSISANFAYTHNLPDYYVLSTTFPASAAAGDTIGGAVGITVANQGAGHMDPSQVSAGIYISNDALVTPEDILLWKGRIIFAGLGSAETRTLPVDPGLQIPTTIAAGTYTIGVIVDDNDAVIERNDGNNTSSRTITISGPGYDHLELLGGWPYGTTVGIDADGSRQVALRGHGGLMEIVNISDPSHPAVMSRLNFGPGQVNAIKIIGNLAYIAGGTRFFVADISTLSNPRVIGSCGGIQSNIRDFDIAGNYAYVSDYHYGLRVIDISVPTAPVAVGFLPFDSRTRLIRAFGNIAYVQRSYHIGTPAGVRGLSIVDASDHAHPVERSFLNLNIGDLAIDSTGRYLFLGLNNNYLHIYDVSNPAAPYEVGSYGGIRNPVSMTIVGNRAYVADGNQNRVVILSIADPIHPVEISSYRFQDSTSILRPAIAGNLCLAPSWMDSVKIVDFSNLNSPVQVSSLESVGLLNYADVSYGHAYVATNRLTSNRLKVLNLANLSAVTETASLDTSYYINDVVTSGIHAFLAGGGAGLRAISISDPAHPAEAGFNGSVPQAQDIVISGNYAYVADGSNGLKIFDIRTPVNPILLGSYGTPGPAYQVSVSGKYAYLACDQSGLRIVDISDPMNPREAGSYVPGGTVYVYNVNVWGNYAYVNDNYDILHVIDVSNPANPLERATVDLYYCYGDIGFSGHYMFIPNTFFGLKIVDISNPASPVEVAVDRRLASACDVTVRDNRIYVVDRDAGFYVLEFRTTGESAPPIFNEPFESSPVGAIPSGWSVANHGVSIAVSDARAQEGGRSLYIRGSPYNGANLDKYVSDLGISSGVYKFSFYMSADPINWTGSDGYAIGHLQIQGYTYAMGIKKAAGLYQLCMYGVTEKTVAYPGSVDAWNKYEMLIDIDAHSLDFYFNGTYVGSNTAYNFSAPDRVQLAAGASGPGGGCPTVYYDFVTIEKIR